MRALITGAAGFIGSHLARYLLEQGEDVLGLDCFTAYYPRDEKQAHLVGLEDHPRFRFQSFDLADHNNLAAWLEAERITTIYHLAGQPGVRSSWGWEFKAYAHHNVTATALLLEAAADNPAIRAFVFASSSSVYGDNPGLHRLHEDAELAPVSPYGITKMTCEHLARAYFQLRGVPTVGLRYFTVYGPGQRPDMAFRRFILAARLGVTIEVYGTGRQSRDFTFVADAVNATRRAAELGHPGTVYNIGGGSNVSLLEAVDTLQQIHTNMGGGRFEVRVQGGLRPVGDAMHTSADLTRARTELEWAPSWALAEGLRAQYQWQKEQRR